MESSSGGERSNISVAFRIFSLSFEATCSISSAYLQLRFKCSISLMKCSFICPFSTFEIKKNFLPYFGVQETISANDLFIYCICAEDMLLLLLCW